MEDIQPINIEASIANLLDIYDQNRTESDSTEHVFLNTADKGLVSLLKPEGSTSDDVYAQLQEQTYISSIAEEVGLQSPDHFPEPGE